MRRKEFVQLHRTYDRLEINNQTRIRADICMDMMALPNKEKETVAGGDVYFV